MITSPNKYEDLYYVVTVTEEGEKEQYVTLPYDEPIYNIDLNTREIETPEFLSVLEDHNSEIIWFKADRFYDDFDLYGSTCWIQYKNALKEEHICLTLPKVIKESNHDVLYIPWPVCGPATKAAGKIEFAFHFFRMSEDGQRVMYALNTKPANSKILHGMSMNPVDFLENGTIDIEENQKYAELELMLRTLNDRYARLEGKYSLNWIEVE